VKRKNRLRKKSEGIKAKSGWFFRFTSILKLKQISKEKLMKSKLGIFTALILSLIIAGSAFASPAAVSAKRAAAVKAKVAKTTTKKAKKNRRKRKTVKKAVTTTTTTPKKSK
jgi:hypothetical protein